MAEPAVEPSKARKPWDTTTLVAVAAMGFITILVICVTVVVCFAISKAPVRPW